MCRNIKTLFNFAPPATDDEVRAASLQFVRKLSGFAHPSKANTAAFERSVPAGRIGTPADVADAVAYLASDGASYMHGSTLVVDGGVTA